MDNVMDQRRGHEREKQRQTTQRPDKEMNGTEHDTRRKTQKDNRPLQSPVILPKNEKPEGQSIRLSRDKPDETPNFPKLWSELTTSTKQPQNVAKTTEK